MERFGRLTCPFAFKLFNFLKIVAIQHLCVIIRLVEIMGSLLYT